MNITDDLQVSCINHLAAVCAEGHGAPINSLDNLAAVLADIVNKPMDSIEFLDPNRNPIPGERQIPSILTGSSEGEIILVRENGLRTNLRFPATVGAIEKRLADFGARKTEDEIRFESFEAALLDTLDGCGHGNWSVGNEDWIAYADASTGLFDGKLYLAHHVVVDCESGGFVDTIETRVVEVRGDRPPLGILSQYLDNCWEFYGMDQDPNDEEKEHLQINQDDCLRAIAEFDEHIRMLWSDDPENPRHISINWSEEEEEMEEPFDPVAMGWVGSDGLP